MDIEIIAALISLVGVILSAVLAFIIGRNQARAEIEKVRLEIKAVYQKNFMKRDCMLIQIFMNYLES